MRDRSVAEVSTSKINNTCKRQKSMPPAAFEPGIPATEGPQTHALDRAATCIDSIIFYNTIILCWPNVACRFRVASNGDMRYEMCF